MSANIQYPLLLKPVIKDYLWGGTRLKTEYGKNLPHVPLAETWECSTHPDGQSIAASGEHEGQTLREVLREHPEYAAEAKVLIERYHLLAKMQ
jgi:mannose-6-phosphate isomerase